MQRKEIITKGNESKIFLVIGFITAAVLVMIFVKKKPSGTSKVKSSQSEQNVSESSNSSEKKDTSDLNSFKETYKQVDKEDILFAGKDGGSEKFSSYDKPVFVGFTWIEYAPYKEMTPYIENTFDKFRGKAVVKDVEVNMNDGFTSQAGIRVTSTQIFIPLEEDFKFSDKAKSVMDEYFQEVTINGKKGYIHEGLLKENELEILISDMING